jgi:hypothetical protein
VETAVRRGIGFGSRIQWAADDKKCGRADQAGPQKIWPFNPVVRDRCLRRVAIPTNASDVTILYSVRAKVFGPVIGCLPTRAESTGATRPRHANRQISGAIDG